MYIVCKNNVKKQNDFVFKLIQKNYSNATLLLYLIIIVFLISIP